jgi:hypothetical protein
MRRHARRRDPAIVEAGLAGELLDRIGRGHPRTMGPEGAGDNRGVVSHLPEPVC